MPYRYLIYTDLICSLLDPRLVDCGSTLIYVDTYDPTSNLTIQHDNSGKMVLKGNYENYILTLER